MEAILIVSIVGLCLSFLTLAGVIAFIVFLRKRGNGSGGFDPFLSNEVKRLYEKELENAVALKSSIENLEKSLSLRFDERLESRLKEQSNSFERTIGENALKETERMNAFEKGVNETVSKRFSEIVTKNVEQMASINKTMNEMAANDTKRINEFQQGINASMIELTKMVNAQLSISLKTINETVDKSLSDGFKGTSQSMNDLQKQLGIVQEAQKNIQGLQNEISSLKDVLSNNQRRGRYGEFQLEMLLEGLFEGSKGVLYDTQYILQKGSDDEPELKPDAVVFLDGEPHHQMVCIDSKFSLVGYESLFDSKKELNEQERERAKASFKAATRLRIEETSKYVIKGKTVNNALMFIPNDGVFAYIHNEFPDLVETAYKKKVVLVSPTILQPLLASFRVIQIDAKKSKNLAAINEQLISLGKEFGRFMPRWESLNKGIDALTKKSKDFDTSVSKIGKRFEKVTKIDFEEKEENESSIEESKRIEGDGKEA